jgi:hypothetical protein
MVAVRKHLAAPVSKTGSVTTEVGALPTPSANLTIKTEEPIMTTIDHLIQPSGGVRKGASRLNFPVL